MPAFLIFLIVIVLLAVLGVSVLGVAIHLLWWSIIGLVIGGLGRLVVPNDSIGLGTTILGGIAAAILGGLIGDALNLGNCMELLVSVIVAGIGVWSFYGYDRAR